MSTAAYAWTVGSRERTIDLGAARARALVFRVSEDLRAARLQAGLGQADVARAVGLSASQLSRLERGLAPLDLSTLVRLFTILGQELSLRSFPDGEPLRDAGQLALLDRFRQRCHPTIRWRTEVPMPIAGDRRAWDLVGLAAGLRIACDAETRLRDLQALDRRLSLKQRDSGFERIILLVADTRSNRAVIREQVGWVRDRFPVPSRRCLELLEAAIEPDADSLVLV
jgi:transcriptional regulator with XRE-family HTH domain